MLEVSRVLGFFAAVLLVMAVASWIKLFRGPELQRLDRSPAPKAGNVEAASQLLVLTAVLSAVAAFLAIVGWISP
jgi:hypothetical protein